MVCMAVARNSNLLFHRPYTSPFKREQLMEFIQQAIGIAAVDTTPVLFSQAKPVRVALFIDNHAIY